MTYLDIAKTALAEAQSAGSSSTPSLSAAVMRLVSAGGTVRLDGEMLEIALPSNAAPEALEAVETLRRHRAEALELLQALERVKAAGARLPLDVNGNRVVEIPRDQDGSQVRRALLALGYELPIVMAD